MKFFEILKNTSRQSLYTPMYILACGVITFFSWLTNNSLIGMILLISVMCIVLIINEDILPILPILMFIILTTSNNNILNSNKTWPVLIILVIFLIGSFISHIISYPIKLQKCKLALPLVAVSIALFAGGVGYLSGKQYMSGLIFIVSLGPCLLLLYMLIRFYTKPPQGVNYKNYICYIMLTLGLIVVAQFCSYILKSDKPLIDLLRNDVFNLGWGNRNGIAMILIISMPCCFYLAYTHKRTSWLYYSLALIFYIAILISFSRGGILSSSIALIFLLIYSFAKGANRSQLIYVICTFAILASIIALAYTSTLMKLLQKISDMTFTSSGRNTLYEEAMYNFVSNPMFGAGIGYVGNNFNMPDFCIYWYHSTIFQIIGSTGILGIFAYAYFYFVRGKIMFNNLKRFNIILSASIISFEIHSLVDTGTFTPFPYMFIIIALTAVLEYNNSRENMTFLKTINLKNEY